MYTSYVHKPKILIVDDSEMNRAILTDILGTEYEIIEAENGVEGIAVLSKQRNDISIMLLDLVMPEMDGFEVLKIMNDKDWISDVPVVIISAENSSAQMSKAYDLGVADFIVRPFDSLIVRHRVVNTLLLYTKQKKLIDLVADKIYEEERHSDMMIDILSHIVEFRNGESGEHILCVKKLTEMFMNQINEKLPDHPYSQTDIGLIRTASALHDIGKIAIDEKILNKPGRLTPEEFEIMKTHSAIGGDMLKNIVAYQDEPLMKLSYEICRWHHERYDGRGYPDGLVGDQIPIHAQVVALADVYNALTSERCYKSAFPHDEAVKMICEGKCGAFSPLLIECLMDLESKIATEMHDTEPKIDSISVMNITKDLIRHDELMVSKRSLHLIDYERMKNDFFAEITDEMQFEYTTSPDMLTVSRHCAKELGTDEIIMNPATEPKITEVIGSDLMNMMVSALHNTTPDNPVFNYESLLSFGGVPRWYRIIIRTIWSQEDTPRYMGCIGKAMNVHESRSRMECLVEQASKDSITGLLNHGSAKELIAERLTKTGKFVMCFIDIDNFKDLSDHHGRVTGIHVLKHISEKLSVFGNGNQIVAREGCSGYLFFSEYETDIESAMRRLHDGLTEIYEGFPINVSVGAALSETVGSTYEALFSAADIALCKVKRDGGGHYCIYDDSIQRLLSE